MKSHRHLSRSSRLLARGLVGALVVVATAGVTGSTGVDIAHAAGLGAGGEYHPLTPARVFDSRPGIAVNDATPGPRPITGAGSTFDIKLLGLGGIPDAPADVLGVVANITVTEPTATGYLNAYGKDAAAGTAAIINFVAGQTVPNLSIVRPGAEGKLTIKLAAGSGTAHVVVDVFGWFSTSASADLTGARLEPVTPGRIFDTRSGLNRRSPDAPLAAREFVTVPIRGVDSAEPATADIVPASTDVVGVVLNMAGVNNTAASATTHLSVIPSNLTAGASPSTANLNLARGQVKSNMVIVPVDPADGSIRVYNNSGSTHVVLDVVGYLVKRRDETRSGRVVPLGAPYRVFDTREAQWDSVPLGAGQAEDWSFADFAGSVTIGGVAVGKQLGVIGNLTSASLTRQYPTVPVASFLTVYPSDAAVRPTSANLNMTEGPPTPNMVIMKYSSTTTVRVYNYAGNNHYVYDASAVILSD
jgi:hypothetical protein